MADNDDKTGAKRTGTTRATMAPAAVDPAGADAGALDERRSSGGRAVNYDELAGLTDDELDDVATAVQTERRARGRRPHEPKFGLTEGERDELERTGTTTSPFTSVVSHRVDTACKHPDAQTRTVELGGAGVELVQHDGACVRPARPVQASRE